MDTQGAQTGANRPCRRTRSCSACARYVAIFVANALSAWGDHLARLTVAAFVLARSGSPLAAATTLAVSLVPSLFGRSLLGPIADRFPYRYVLIAANVVRAAFVALIIVAVAGGWSLGWLLSLLFLLELAGGPAVTSMRILLTDLFEDRRLYTRAMGLNSLAEQVNQVIGLGIGGVVVFAVGATNALWFDLATFLLGAARGGPTIRHRPVVGTPSAGSWLLPRHRRRWALPRPPSRAGRHAGAGPGDVVGHRGTRGGRAGLRRRGRPATVRRAAHGRPDGGGRGRAAGHRAVAAGAPEQADHHPGAPMPVPLLVTVFQPPVVVTGLLWFLNGALQAFMLPLQATFSLMVTPEMRGRVFGLAGALTVSATGIAFLVSGLVAQQLTAAAAVSVAAVVSLGAILLLAVRWPRRALTRAVAEVYES